MNSLLIIFTFILFVNGSNEEEFKNDQMCKIKRNVLCIKDVLKTIAIVAESINRTAYEIEKYIIVNKNEISDQVNHHVRHQMILIHSQLPTPRHHAEYFRLNNIDKKNLIDLFAEAHVAMSFYYNSINDILKLKGVFTSTTDSWLKQIEFSLKNEIICRYRTILNVYSHEYPLINEVNRIKFFIGEHENAPSFIRNAHSIIISRLLCEWMERLHSVIVNLGTKFY